MDISFIVPVYNVCSYIEICVKSLICQKGSSVEIILIDDGSTDGSETICDEMAQLDQRIKVIHQTNQGVAAARNHGIEICVGKWVCFVDADDWIDTDFVQRMEHILEENIDICWFSYADVSGKHKKKYNIKTEEKILFDKKDFDLCIKGVFNQDLACKYDFKKIRLVTPWAKLYRTEFLRQNNLKFTEGMRIGEDIVFNLQVYAVASRGVYLDEVLYYYRTNLNSVTKTFNKNVLTDYSRILVEMEKWIRDNPARTCYWTNYYERVMIIYAYFVVRYICHKKNSISWKEKKRIYIQIRNSEPYKSALQHVDIKHYSLKKRILIWNIINTNFFCVNFIVFVEQIFSRIRVTF